MLYAERIKAYSALLTQARIGKIGFNEFLHKRIPGFDTKRCACDYSAISVRNVLLSCPRWVNKREKKLRKLIRDLKEVLETEYGATAAIRLILKTGLLKQFKATV
jgi:hypothetical protein